MLKLIFRVLCTIIGIACFFITLQWLFNGGIDSYGATIKDLGFWGFVKDFFVSIWNGFKTTVGIK